MNYVKELLDNIGKRIAEEELAVREKIDRITHMAHPDDVEDQIREEWHKFHLRIKPMQDQQEHVLKQLLQLEVCKPPAPIIIPASHLRSP